MQHLLLQVQPSEILHRDLRRLRQDQQSRGHHLTLERAQPHPSPGLKFI